MPNRSSNDIIFYGIRINPTICAAIRKRVRLQCEYDERTRIIEPQCHGLTKDLSEVVRVVETSPGNNFGEPFEGKLYTLSKMADLKKTGDKFSRPGPHYNPEDKAMKYVHCHL